MLKRIAVGDPQPELLKNIIIRRIIDHHTQPADAGIVFNRTKPKLAVYTHIAQLGTSFNFASGLCDEVADGQLLMDDTVRTATTGMAKMRKLADRRLKGFPRPVTVYRLLSM